jgi:DNA invertase Pin-like site-specific DNA recombinase
MSRALKEIEAGNAGGLVAFDLSRLSREPEHREWLFRHVAKIGGTILYPGMPEDPASPQGILQVGLQGEIDRHNRLVAKERFEMARKRATREGIFIGATLPFGYRRREDRRTEVDPVNGPVVTELFQRRLTGENMGDLARWLSERTGHKWSRTGVRDLLSRELYMTGRLTNGETVSDWDCGALVDAADWHAVQVLRRSVQAGRNAKGTHLLSGLLLCGSCGHRMVYVKPAKKQSKGTRPKYRCPNALKCPKRVHVHGDVAEDLVVKEAFRVSKKLVVRSAEAVDVAPFEEALAKAERRLAQMEEPSAQDAFGDRYLAVVKERREARDAAAVALSEARRSSGASGDGVALALGHLWEDLDPLAQREALAWTFESVTAFPTEARGKRTGRRSPAPPKLEFVARSTRPWKPIEFSPPTFEIDPDSDFGRFLDAKS